MKKLICLILTLTLLLSLGVTAFADKGTETVSITYRGIKIVADGVTLDPRDANGNPTEPFIMGDSTYLPVRAVADALGLKVDWVGATSTVTLTSGGEKTSPAGAPAASKETRSADITYRDIKIVIDGKEIVPTDANGNPVEPFIMDGTTYLPVRAVASALGLEVGWDAATSTVTLSGSAGEAGSYRLVKETRHWLSDAVGKRVDVVTYTYDRAGNLIEARERFGNGEPDTGTRYTYDNAGRMLTSEEFTGQHNYHLATYSYDSAGRLSKVTTTMGSTLIGTTYYSYNAAGLLIREETVSEDLAGDYVKTYTYNERGLLIKKESGYTDVGKTVVVTYSYDDAGRLISQSNGSSITRYSYDSQGRLSLLTEGDDLTITYTYDSNGNLVTELSDASGTYLDCRIEYEYEYEIAN